ncbi:MAG: META domain-containing protein, partial [Treponema sp.]|nr:META domain-containing protein [Treponema sp.]
MKKLFLTVVGAVWMLGCSSAPQFSQLTGKEWKLIEVRVNGKTTGFNRNALGEVFSEAFTVSFDNENISGTGAPNRYSAPFTLEKDQKISIKLVRSTLMASIFEPENLREHEFFVYIQNTNEWNLVKNNLEL